MQTTSEQSHHGDVHHEELGFIRKYIFSTDHKVIGIQYGVTAIFFFLFGFSLMLLMRWQIAYPAGTENFKPVPIVADLIEKMLHAESTSMSDGVISSDFYNTLGAMHGTIMVFLAVVPMAFGAFGNFVVPLQIGAVDMTFPKINAASYWCYFAGGIVMVVSFFLPGGAASSGWTSYTP